MIRNLIDRRKYRTEVLKASSLGENRSRLPRVWFCRGLWRCSFNPHTEAGVWFCTVHQIKLKRRAERRGCGVRSQPRVPRLLFSPVGPVSGQAARRAGRCGPSQPMSRLPRLAAQDACHSYHCWSLGAWELVIARGERSIVQTTGCTTTMWACQR